MTGRPMDYWEHRRTPGHSVFRAARDLLLAERTDHERASRLFRWPRLPQFNWALEWFDVIAAGNQRPALVLLDGRGGAREHSYAELAARSDSVALWLSSLGVGRGDRVLIVLGQRVELWECLLACMKLGAVVIPSYTNLTAADAADRVRRGGVRHLLCDSAFGDRFDAVTGPLTRIAVGGARRGWHDYASSREVGEPFYPDARTEGDAVAFGYFTSGTTSRPKLVSHTHVSYPVGHLSSMYWNGLLPGDRHLNVSAPGWAKHMWSSFFVPFNAEATVVAMAEEQKPLDELPELLARNGIDSFCAPPSVWRAMDVRASRARPRLREATSAGEPLDEELSELIARRWGVRVRDGYGQTETTCLAGTTPGLAPRPGWLGPALPGYRISLRDPETGLSAHSGEVCVELAESPVGITGGYLGDETRTAAAFERGYYRTGDLGERDEHGWIRILGRGDDVFKSFGHRLSPYELEAVLRAHPAVADAAVIARPHPVGGATPHAVVVAAEGRVADEELADRLFSHVATQFPAELCVRSLEFTDRLPKTESGKVRRSELTAGPRSFVSAGASGPVDTEVDTEGVNDARRHGIAQPALSE